MIETCNLVKMILRYIAKEVSTNFLIFDLFLKWRPFLCGSVEIGCFHCFSTQKWSPFWKKGKIQKNGTNFSSYISEDHFDQVTSFHHYYSQILSDLRDIQENRKKQ